MRTSSWILPTLALLAILGGGLAADEKQSVVTFSFEDEDVRPVLQVIVDFAGASAVVGQEVEGRVSVQLRAVPWRAALEQVAGMVGAVVEEGDHRIFKIYVPAKVATLRIYDVKDLAAGAGDLLAWLRGVVSRAELALQDGNVIVSGSEADHAAIRAELGRMRAAVPRSDAPSAAELGAIRLSVEWQSGQVERLLKQIQLGLKRLVGATSGARERLSSAQPFGKVVDLPATEVLDAIVRLARVRWTLLPQAIVFHLPEETADGWFVLGGKQLHHAPGEKGEADVVVQRPAGLEARLQMLEAELQVLSERLQRLEALLEQRER